jgi:CBS domain containing-hemolysin-like protein
MWVHNNPAQAVMAMASYMRVALWLLMPVSALLAPVTLRGIHDDDEDAIVLSNDGMRLIMPNDGEDSEIEESEKEMIASILEMDDTVAREVMVPRIDMVSLEADISFAEALDVIIGAGHSRVPVYDDYVDQIIGVLYAKDMLRCYQQGGTDMPIRTLLRPAYFVPLTKNVKNLLAEMRKHRVHIAIVVDEYGGTAGLVTIEDILEEIVGEIQDEYDAVEEILVQRVGDDSFLLSARLDLYSLAKLLDIEMDDEDADTVGGLVLGLLGHVPEAGESVEHLGWRFTVIMVEGRRIEQVRVEPVALPDEPHEDERRATRPAGARSESPASSKPAHNTTT